MNNPNFDDDLIQDYLAECREHLLTIETDLLAMEQGGIAVDEELVNQVFRAAHSIKGGAGFFGLATIRELAHKTENVLEMVRSRQLTAGPQIISVLLRAFDKLRELIENFSSSEGADIADYVRDLTQLTKEKLSSADKETVDTQIVIARPEMGRGISVSAFDLSQARRGGKSVYLIKYDLIHDVQRRGQSPMDLIRKLIRCGNILETVFDLDSAGTLDDEVSNELILEVLYATALEPDLIGQLVEVDSDRIFVIEKDGGMIALPTYTAAVGEPMTEALLDPPLSATIPPAAVAQPEPAPNPVPSPASAHQAPPGGNDVTVRLNVALLDSLMTAAGELVLSRNQLNEAISRKDDRGLRVGAQRLSLVTSELQEMITLTRMRPLGGLFAKFSRLVRDLAKDLGKEIQLKIEGSEVEIDKTLLEGLSDPLTHMIRNAVDHGVESPEKRAAAGKSRIGAINLKAAHEAGQVVIEVSDDGKGLQVDKITASALAKGLITQEKLQVLSDRERLGLILLPGLSTAEKVSDVSGRGVGMDVVKTNLDKLGGKIEIDSVPGRGSQFKIKLPLTLAIIPSLHVSSRGERFAIPQANVSELIRIPVSQIESRTDRAGDAVVLKLRDRLVPLVTLSAALDVADASLASRALNVVLVNTGTFEYGLVVEQLHDTVEIVVKPLGRHLKDLREYAGATILGDGHVALILDVTGLASRAGLSPFQRELKSGVNADAVSTAREAHSLLLFRNGPNEPCAVPIELVSRIERIRATQIEHLGGRRTMQYRGLSLPLLCLSDVASLPEIPPEQHLVAIVFERAGRSLGLLAAEPIDMLETTFEMDSVTLRQPGIAGSAVVEGRSTLLIDIVELANAAAPASIQPQPSLFSQSAASSAEVATILLAEDSDFFRGQMQRMMEAVGYKVLAAEDGERAWEMLDAHPNDISVITTDIEMPRLDGLAFTRRIRSDGRFSELPIIAISSLSAEEEVKRAFEAGITDYQVKIDQDQLLKSIHNALQGRAHQPAPAI